LMKQFLTPPIRIAARNPEVVTDDEDSDEEEDEEEEDEESDGDSSDWDRQMHQLIRNRQPSFEEYLAWRGLRQNDTNGTTPHRLDELTRGLKDLSLYAQLGGDGRHEFTIGGIIPLGQTSAAASFNEGHILHSIYKVMVKPVQQLFNYRKKFKMVVCRSSKNSTPAEEDKLAIVMVDVKTKQNHEEEEEKGAEGREEEADSGSRRRRMRMGRNAQFWPLVAYMPHIYFMGLNNQSGELICHRISVTMFFILIY